ncbi:hypothetical protein NBRC116602_22240 [Hyphomicrobiales bacterium 4NK60-0047b]|jgi:hypothetical protein
MNKLLSLVVAMVALTMLSISGAQAGGSDGGQKYNPAKRYSSMMTYKRHRPHYVIVKKKVIIKKKFVKKNNRKIKKLIRKIKHLKRNKRYNKKKIRHLKKVLKRLKRKHRGHKRHGYKRIVRKKIIIKKVRIVKHSRPCGRSHYSVKHKKFRKPHDRRKTQMGGRPSKGTKMNGGNNRNRNRNA